VTSRADNPAAWALLVQSLSLALDALAARTGDVAALDEAIAGALAGREVFAARGQDVVTLDSWIADMQARRAASGP